jgi:hypothetical protein
MKQERNDKKGESLTLDTVVWKGGMVGQKSTRRKGRSARKSAEVGKILVEKRKCMQGKIHGILLREDAHPYKSIRYAERPGCVNRKIRIQYGSEHILHGCVCYTERPIQNYVGKPKFILDTAELRTGTLRTYIRTDATTLQVWTVCTHYPSCTD